MPETPLDKIVAIRSETDMEIVRNFTDAQKKIRNDWANRDIMKNEQKYTENMNKLFGMLRA